MSSSFLKLAAISTLVVGLAGCSTVYNGATTDVAFALNGADNADCYVQNQDYKVHINAPMTYPLQNSRYPYEVVCYKRGYKTFVGTITPAVSESHSLNALNAGVGVPVDFASGSVFALPTSYDITMLPLDGSNVLGFEEKSQLIAMDPIIDKPEMAPDLKFVYKEDLSEKEAVRKEVRITNVETVTGYDFPIVEQTEKVIKREPKALTETRQVREVIDIQPAPMLPVQDKVMIQPKTMPLTPVEIVQPVVEESKKSGYRLIGQSATGAPVDVRNPYNN